MSLGLYYALRSAGIDVFWSLTLPAVAVAALAVSLTWRHRSIDTFGLLVLAELLVAVGFTVATRDPRIVALRDPVYFAIGGAFCVGSVAIGRPVSHVSAKKIASAGNPAHARSFDLAWVSVRRYRLLQRLLSLSTGLIVIITSTVRAVILWRSSQDSLASAVDHSNYVLLVGLGGVAAVGIALVLPARKIVEEVAEQSLRGRQEEV